MRARSVTNRSAADSMIAAMAKLGRLEPIDDALVHSVRTLASAVDDDPTHASLWAQYRGALDDLRSVGADLKVDEFGELLKQLDALSAPVVDSAPKRSKVKRG